MYESAVFFDPISMTKEDAGNGFPQPVDDGNAVVTFNNGESFNPDTHLIHYPNQLHPYDQSNWDTQQNGPQEPNHMIPLAFSGDLPSSSNWLFYPPQPPLFGASYEDGNGAHFNNFVPDHQFDGDSDMAFIGRRRRAGKEKNPIISERQRRVEMNDKFKVLKSLVPNSNTKTDRASVVGDACEYIKELQRTVNELKLLVEKKRFGRDERTFVDLNASSRNSWLQRKSKDTEVDVRIIDNEVTIKVVQRKKIDCLLVVTKVLDELQLDLHHVAGGQIGDYSSLLFNTKIYEGSCVHAGAVAHKLIEVMDKQYAAVPQNRLL